LGTSLEDIVKLSEFNVLVTGGASGMGRAFVLAFARDGANVAFCDVSPEGIAAVEAEAASLPGKVVGFAADVSDEAQVVQLVKSAREALGRLNGLVNNAGIFRDGLLVKQDRETGAIKTMSLSAWNKVIAVDLTGPFLCAREFASSVIENGDGPAVIVNISSIARHGNPGQTNYSAAKAGLVADTKLWATELSRYGIRTGAVAPGFVRTPILEGMRPEVLDGMLKAVPLRRVAEPEEIFLAVKFIVECDYFTGRCIDVDGGMVL
jgi:3-oxoacyl-[acyl-carrier protein] reductase